MTAVSRRVVSLKTSPASVLAKRARELRAAGKSIILLSSGELDFATPEHVVEAADRAARAVPVGYTNIDGDAGLKEAVRSKFGRDNKLNYEADQIQIGNGSKQIVFNALMATVDQGDEVIIPAPYWASYIDLAEFAGAVPVIVQTSQASNWKITPDLLAQAITSRTRWLIINNPVNPTGGVYSASELQALAEVLDKHPHVMVLSDDLYEHIIFDRTPFATMASAAPGLYDRTLTINGVSKTYAMMGWRIGYGAGPRALISNMVKVQSQSTSNACTVSQAAAEAALAGPQDEVARRIALLNAARISVVDRISKIKGLSLQVPTGTFYAYICCGGVITKIRKGSSQNEGDRGFSEFLLDSAGVVVLPGEDCGLSPYFRINFAINPADLDEALGRIGRTLGHL